MRAEACPAQHECSRQSRHSVRTRLPPQLLATAAAVVARQLGGTGVVDAVVHIRQQLLGHAAQFRGVEGEGEAGVE